MDAINVIIVIFVFINVIVNIFWDGIIAFDHFDWVDKLCGNWDDLKKHFTVNQCERWISSINFCLMTVFGIVLIYGITKIGIKKGSDTVGDIGISAVDNPIDNITGGKKSVNTLYGPTWVFAFGLCYVLARLILVSATLLTSNLNDKWLSVIPATALQVFVLGLIITTYGTKVFSENGDKIAIGFFIGSILLTLILPFVILRLIPTKETENDINFKFSFNKSS
tara:strand:+ start:744 stop:1412 length:669 start_codon:yes stop_codon:yes gene_type:complete